MLAIFLSYLTEKTRSLPPAVDSGGLDDQLDLGESTLTATVCLCAVRHPDEVFMSNGSTHCSMIEYSFFAGVNQKKASALFSQLSLMTEEQLLLLLVLKDDDKSPVAVASAESANTLLIKEEHSTS